MEELYPAVVNSRGGIRIHQVAFIKFRRRLFGADILQIGGKTAPLIIFGRYGKA